MYNEDENENLKSFAKLSIDSFTWVGLLISLVISCTVVRYVASPTYQEARIIRAGNEIKKESIENNNLLLVKIVKANDENKKLNNEGVKKIKSFISNRNNYEDYLIHIVKLANSKNIEISNFSVNENENKSKTNSDNVLKEIEISFSVSSGFQNFISFLRFIEQGVPLVQEESISISAGNKNDGISEQGDFDAAENRETILDYEVKLKFYHY